MTTCLEKSCSFLLLCISYVNAYQFFVCPSFPFGFESGLWDLIELSPYKIKRLITAVKEMEQGQNLLFTAVE